MTSDTPPRLPIPFPFPGGRGGGRAPIPQPQPGYPPVGGVYSTGGADDRVNVMALREMTDDSGGRTEIVRDFRDLDPAVAGIADELSQQYYLGYPSPGHRDGRWHTIRVEVRDRSLQVRARKGYVAPRGRVPDTRAAAKDAASPELKEAIESPLPLPALPLAVTASVFKGPAGKGSVVFSTLVHGGTLPFVEKDGMFTNDLEVLGIATDDRGRNFATDRNTVNLRMKPDTATRVKGTGFRVIQSLDLAPGRYVLRVAVRENNTTKAGSVSYDLEVPDFFKGPLVMSDLALTSAMSGIAPTIRPKDPLEKLLPGPLTTYREFPQDDEVAVFAEIYDNVKPAHTTEVVATVKAEGGQTVFETREERDSAELAGAAGGYGFQTRVPLKSLAPGLYVLRVEATSRLGDRPTVFRETVFRVQPASQP